VDKLQEEFSQWWNFTDKIFRLLQWTVFVSIVSYAADRTGSTVLYVVSVLLWCLLIGLTWKFSNRYLVPPIVIFFGTTAPKFKKWVLPIMASLALGACVWVMSGVHVAFEYFESHH
jgi:hypothetical protein